MSSFARCECGRSILERGAEACEECTLLELGVAARNARRLERERERELALEQAEEFDGIEDGFNDVEPGTQDHALLMRQLMVVWEKGEMPNGNPASDAIRGAALRLLERELAPEKVSVDLSVESALDPFILCSDCGKPSRADPRVSDEEIAEMTRCVLGGGR